MSEMDSHIIQLIEEYLSREMGEPQKEELMNWLNERKENRLFFERITQESVFKQRWEQWSKIDSEAAIRRFDRRTGHTSQFLWQKHWWAYTAVAAVVLLVVGLSIRQLMQQQEEPVALVETIEPGSDKAILVLADGKEVKLEKCDSLQVNLGAGSQLVNKNNQLVYRAEVADELQYNELRIPRGGEYEVKLADGTTVSLNSNSSLKYPVAFGRDKRVVELTGEGYFEVAKGETPFYVKVNELTIRVYGTIFNVNSHRQNRIQTALVEGKVSILLNEREYMMKASQLADFDVLSNTLDIHDADLTSNLAWTKGLFVFNNETLEQIMATLSLWYDVEVFFQNTSLKELHFTGCVKRYDSIDTILKALSQSVGVKINKQGKALTISN